jgi:hypothetical protein
MAFAVTTATSTDAILGTLRIRAGFSFRQRAALNNSPVLGTVTIYRKKDGSLWKEEEGYEESPRIIKMRM